ncbi:MAG TPA: hypothetical protein VFE55_02390 [Acidimicrobiia bacterium]|nr:hypothetical protein [Acidimicrobiia bacterium]
MRIRSAFVVAATVVVSAVGGVAAPAFAHEEINPKTFPTGQPTFFTLTAANEEKADLVKIVLTAPAGVAFGETTRSPAGWSVNRTDSTITWTGGAVKPDNFDTWGYEIDSADQPGTLAYKVTLGFADGKTDDVEVDVTATVPAATGTTGATPTSSATVTTGAAAPSTVQSGAQGSGTPSRSGSDGTAKAALALAIVALLVAAGALVAGVRTRSPKPPAGGGGAAGAAQDW